jgi:hypothetical protein
MDFTRPSKYSFTFNMTVPLFEKVAIISTVFALC